VEPIEGAILAAGRGERLRVEGPDLPKPLVLLEGESLLARQARLMLEAGVSPVVAVVNSETAGLIETGATALPPALKIIVRDTPNSMETLFQLGEHLRTQFFLAATVDAVFAPDEMARFVNRAAALSCGNPSLADGVLGVTRWRGDELPLFVEVDNSGAIRKIGADRAAMVTGGVYFLPSSIFAFRNRARQAGLSALRQFLAGLVEWGVRLHAIELDEVIDIDVARDLEAARRMIAKAPVHAKPPGDGSP
jgi:choline kinase